MVDVYVDDFLLAAQTKREQIRLLRNTLHSIDSVFRPLAPHDPSTRKAPASIKKMHQGDAHWAYRKQMLSWVIPHRLTRLYALLDDLRLPRRRMAISHGIVLLGELRSHGLSHPGLHWFVLDPAGHSCGDKHRVRLTPLGLRLRL
jgi:hypothetical protein